MTGPRLEGWVSHPNLGDGWLCHPDYAGWLRSPDGRWWSEADVREQRVVMTERGPKRAAGWLVAGDGTWIPVEESPVERVRDRLRTMQGSVPA